MYGKSEISGKRGILGNVKFVLFVPMPGIFCNISSMIGKKFGKPSFPFVLLLLLVLLLLRRLKSGAFIPGILGNVI